MPIKKFINQDDMKQANYTDIFNLIKTLRQTTRKQIESITRLSWGAVSNITSRLLENGYIVEFKTDESCGPGRIPTSLMVNNEKYYTLGLDINITEMCATLVNLRNEEIRRWNRRSDYSSKNVLLNSVLAFTGDVLKDITTDIKNATVLGIGTAMQGIVDTEKGMSVKLTQCSDWMNIPLAGILTENFHIPAYLEHDPDCILFAEAEARGSGNTVLFRIDRGIGMAVMIQGEIVGNSGMFEIAHTTAVPGGAVCSCGNRGCLEAYVSINGMEQLYDAPFKRLTEDAKSGKKDALRLFSDMALYLGIAVYNVQCLFNADTIVLCGEMMAYKELFLDEVRRYVLRSAGKSKLQFLVTDVKAAAYGAALIAIEKSISHIGGSC